jgi:hypothetical protein
LGKVFLGTKAKAEVTSKRKREKKVRILLLLMTRWKRSELSGEDGGEARRC